MTSNHEALIRSTWAAAAPHAAVLVDRFYQLLFDMVPESRALFIHTDRASLERKFLATMDELVRVIDHPERLVSVLGQLGRRHSDYGVDRAHYEVARVALLVALRETCGPSFTDEADEAWRELYNLVAAVMLRGGSKTSSVEPASLS